jgi:hypothetical protein
VSSFQWGDKVEADFSIKTVCITTEAATLKQKPCPNRGKAALKRNTPQPDKQEIF